MWDSQLAKRILGPVLPGFWHDCASLLAAGDCARCRRGIYVENQYLSRRHPPASGRRCEPIDQQNGCRITGRCPAPIRRVAYMLARLRWRVKRAVRSLGFRSVFWPILPLTCRCFSAQCRRSYPRRCRRHSIISTTSAAACAPMTATRHRWTPMVTRGGRKPPVWWSR